MKSLKEIRLGLGTTPDAFPLTKKPGVNSLGGLHTSADSHFSSRLSNIAVAEDYEDYEDDSEDEDDDMKKENILNKRVYKDNSYNLSETLDRLDEFLDVGDLAQDAMAAFKKNPLTKIISNAAKSGLGGVPVVDVILGSWRLSKLAGAIREFSDEISITLGRPSGYFGDALKSENDNEWEVLIGETLSFMQQSPGGKEKIGDLYNEVLEKIKDLVITLVESYDTVVAFIVGLVGTPALSAGAVAVSNLSTSIASFGARTIPFERVLFSGGGYIASGIDTIFSLFRGDSAQSDDLAALDTEDGVSSLEKLKSGIDEMEKAGGSVISAFIYSPVKTLARLHRYYEVVGNPDAYYKEFERMLVAENKYSILFLLESVEKDSDQETESFEEIDLSEFSGAGGIAMGTAPLGKKGDGSVETASQRNARIKAADIYSEQIKLKEKAVNEQRERIALLQAFHQKTTNKLK